MIGTTPVYAPDGRVQATTWVSYADAKAEAEKRGLSLVVLVDVDDETRSTVARSTDSATTIVCTATPAEAAKFRSGPGVYRYTRSAGRLVGGKQAAAPIGASARVETIVLPRPNRAGGCVDGRCGR